MKLHPAFPQPKPVRSPTLVSPHNGLRNIKIIPIVQEQRCPQIKMNFLWITCYWRLWIRHQSVWCSRPSFIGNIQTLAMCLDAKLKKEVFPPQNPFYTSSDPQLPPAYHRSQQPAFRGTWAIQCQGILVEFKPRSMQNNLQNSLNSKLSYGQVQAVLKDWNLPLNLQENRRVTWCSETLCIAKASYRVIVAMNKDAICRSVGLKLNSGPTNTVVPSCLKLWVV